MHGCDAAGCFGGVATSPADLAPVEYTLASETALTTSQPVGVKPLDLSAAGDDAERFAAARLHLRQFSETGNARYLGYAHATIGTMRNSNKPELLLLKARIQQSRHEFTAAAETLKPLLEERSSPAEAWLLATDSLRRAGDVGQARKGCVSLALSGRPELSHWCAIQVLQSSGNDERAFILAREGLTVINEPGSDLHRWALEITADTAARIGENALAVSLYRQALETGLENFATRLALADVLLQQGEADAVLELLDGHEENVAALIRMAIAKKIAGSGADDQMIERIEASFSGMTPGTLDDPRLRDRAIFELRFNEDVTLALDYTIANWQQQKGPEDFDLLRETAVKTNDPVALALVATWQARQGREARI